MLALVDKTTCISTIGNDLAFVYAS